MNKTYSPVQYEKRRKAALAKIHVARKDRGLDDLTYKATIFRLIKKESCSQASLAELDKIIKYFKEEFGWVEDKKYTNPSKKPGSQQALIQKYWQDLAATGTLHNPTDQGLRAFISNQTGISDIRFLKRSEDANKVIEALKAMLSRAKKGKRHATG